MSKAVQPEGTIEINEEYHRIGDRECRVCCCDRATPCGREGCDGLVHNTLEGEEEWGDNEWVWVHTYRCDRCGVTEGPC